MIHARYESQDQIVTITFRAAELDSANGIFQQALLGQPSAEPLSGDIITRADVEFTSDDGRIQSGVWESEPGKSRWEFLTRGEIITIVSGAMTVEEDDGAPVHLVAGTSAIFPIGWKGTWTVTETVRKVFVVYNV